MKIKKIEYFRLDMPLAVPYKIAYETVTHSSNVILKLITDKGITGWGCAAPDVEVTGETADDVIRNIETVVMETLMGESPFQIAKVIHDLKGKLSRSSSTIAMVDIALYDLLARKAQLPLYCVLGGYKHAIPTSITIGIIPVEETMAEAEYYLKKGFTIIKLKGGLSLEEDIEKIRKLREKFGNEFLLRFDANQGYSPEESMSFMDRSKSANIEIFEQPTTRRRGEKLEALTGKDSLPIMADESVKTLKDAFGLASDDLTNMLNIKIMKVGGILESKHINSVAKASGMEVMVGCLDECALGISAGLHFALSCPNIEYADLDGHLDLLDDPFSNLFELKNGVLYPSEAIGLGDINI